MARFHRLAKEGSWILVSQIVSVLGSLVLVRVLTDYLEPSEYGQLALGLTVASLINQVVMVGLTAGIGRFYSIAIEEGDLPGYIRATLRLLAIAALVVMVISLVLLVVLFWLGYFQWMGLVAAALVFSVFSGYSASLNSMQNAARQRATVAVLSGVDALLKILLAVGVIQLLGHSGTAVIIGYTLSSLIVMGVQLYLLRRLGSPQEKKKPQLHENWEMQIWKYSLPFSAWGVFTWAQQVSDRWALQNFGSTDEVGLYAVLFQLGYVPLGVATSFAMSLIGPILYQRSGNASDHTRNTSVHLIAWRITFGGLLMTALAFVFTFLMHEWIFKLLVAARYRSVSYLLPWIVLAGGNFAACQMLALKLMSEMKSRAMTAAKISTAILGVSMNLLGALWFGVPGVVAALVIFSIINFFWMAFLAWHPARVAAD